MDTAAHKIDKMSNLKTRMVLEHDDKTVHTEFHKPRKLTVPLECNTTNNLMLIVLFSFFFFFHFSSLFAFIFNLLAARHEW